MCSCVEGTCSVIAHFFASASIRSNWIYRQCYSVCVVKPKILEADKLYHTLSYLCLHFITKITLRFDVFQSRTLKDKISNVFIELLLIIISQFKNKMKYLRWWRRESLVVHVVLGPRWHSTRSCRHWTYFSGPFTSASTLPLWYPIGINKANKTLITFLLDWTSIIYLIQFS